MALALWVAAKISLKVGCTYVGKFATKSMLGPLTKALLSSPMAAKVLGRMTRFGLEKGVGRLLGANSLFVNRGPFDYTTWTHEETIASTIAVEVAEAKGPGERARFAALRAVSPALRLRLKHIRQARHDGSLPPTSLRARLYSLLEPMPVCPNLTRDHPEAIAEVTEAYLRERAHGKGLSKKWERYKWHKLLRAIDRLENYQFVKLLQILHRWQAPALFSRERHELKASRTKGPAHGRPLHTHDHDQTPTQPTPRPSASITRSPSPVGEAACEGASVRS